MQVDYGFSRPLLLRTAGALLALLGALVVVLAVLVQTVGLPGGLLGAGMVVAAVSVLAIAALAGRARAVLRLDDTGYEVRWLRGAGVKGARWREVHDVVTAEVGGLRCVVIRLRDGRSTSLPVDVLDVRPHDLVEALSAHLDAGHGYRRL